MAQIQCLHFNGYKPCGVPGASPVCRQDCKAYQKKSDQILIVHLGALGAVVRSTALLESVKLKHPNCQIHWLTEGAAVELLSSHPDLYRVWNIQQHQPWELKSFFFNSIYVIDKSLRATSFAQELNFKHHLGFKAENGSIVPANNSAHELWEIGLNNRKKFFENKKSEIQLVHEALELKYSRGEYSLPLLQNEKYLAQERMNLWKNGKNLKLKPALSEKKIIGLNTGCSTMLPEKKLSTQNWAELTRLILNNTNHFIVLLGGAEDWERNAQIKNDFLYEDRIILSPHHTGIRDGLISINACDCIITGDSLGMHMAISQKKMVLAWFGPSCVHEIDFYDRGIGIKSNFECSPCWNRNCQKPLKCNQAFVAEEIFYSFMSLNGLSADKKNVMNTPRDQIEDLT